MWKFSEVRAVASRNSLQQILATQVAEPYTEFCVGWLSPTPMALGTGPHWGDCYSELPRILLPRNPMNKVNEHKVAGLVSPSDVVGNIKSGKRASQKRGDPRSHERCKSNSELVEGEGPFYRPKPHQG